ncbi:MAG: hypothetical protein MRY74_00455 [Neomegalonema sp.]|nr:hypothetical protein [Neomegalonema sp.]
MAREGVSVNGAGQSTVRPSRVIQALAALTTLYLAIAAFYAVSHAAGAVYAGGQLKVSLLISIAAAVAFVALASRVYWRFGTVLALSLSFIAQLAWASWVEPEALPGTYNHQLLLNALSIGKALQAGYLDTFKLHASSSPSATMVYAIASALFGGEGAFLRMLSAGLWTAQAWLVWRICEEVSELRSRGFIATMLFGLAPGLIVFGGQPSVEAVYGFFALLGVFLVLSHRKRGLGVSAFLSGICGALAYLAHPSGLAYVAGLLIVLLVGLLWERRWRGRWRMGMAFCACLLGFGVGAAPQGLLNVYHEGPFSIAPGIALGEQLFYGSNKATEGDIRSSDTARRIGLEGEKFGSLRFTDLRAREAAFKAILSDVPGHVYFALTTKMKLIWSSEEGVLGPSRNAPKHSPTEFDASPAGQLAPGVINGVYLAILLMATLGAARMALRSGAVRDPTRWVLIFFAVLCLATAHVFMRAHPVAHLAFMPLLVLLAPISVARLPRVLSVRREAKEREAEALARRAEADKAFDLAEIHRPKPVDPEVAARSPEERLANVLKGMSKPPRPDSDEVGDEAQSQEGDGSTPLNVRRRPPERDASA